MVPVLSAAKRAAALSAAEGAGAVSGTDAAGAGVLAAVIAARTKRFCAASN